MALAGGHHVEIAGVPFWLDEGYEALTGRRPYVHGGRSIFAGRTDITGRPGSQNLKEDYLVWALTRFEGEGQVVLDPADPDSAFRFYRSEGLNTRVPGQLSLNKSVLSETVSVSAGANTTAEGAADFTDVTGTSTTTGTDRKLVAVGDKVGQSANYTPGLTTNQVDFYLYREPFSSYGTTIQGNNFINLDGSPQNSGGSDKILTRGDAVWSAKLDSGTELTAGQATRVELYASVASATRGQLLTFQVLEVTGAHNNLIAGGLITVENTSGLASSLAFTPKAGKSYRVKLAIPSGIEPTPVQVTVDKIIYGADVVENTATIEIWNQTAGTSVTSKAVSVTASAAGSLVGSITFAAAAATNYRARVARTSGKQAMFLDKVIEKPLANAVWTIDCLDFGLSQKIWLGGHAAAVDSRGFQYNTSTDAWDSTVTFNDGAATTAATTLAMTHSDSLEYFLLNSNEVYTSNAAGTDDRFAYFSSAAKTLVGMTIAQNRLMLMSEDTSAAGVYLYSVPLDDTSTNPWDLLVSAPSTGVSVLQLPVGSKTADTTFRQRMCSTPTGARFFVNFSDVTSKVYEFDVSGDTPLATEIADLGSGIKATAITYDNGITFVAGLYYGDSSASDSDKLPRAALFAIDQNSIIQRIGFFRYDSPDPRGVQYMIPYQTSIYMLQGNYAWRYDLINGGLFLEYQLSPQTPGNQRSLAVLFGRIFAAYSDEVFVAGSVGTYRQGAVTSGSTFTTSVYDFGIPSVKKALAKIEVTTDTMPSNTSVTIEYQVDQNGTWVAAGTMASGVTQNFYIQEVSFTTLQLRARLATQDGVSTPVLKSITVWASAAEDEEYFDLVLRTEDEDSYDRIAGEAAPGSDKSKVVVQTWRNKAVTSFKDGYGTKAGSGEDYLVTIEDLRVEQIQEGEGRTVVTLRVVR